MTANVVLNRAADGAQLAADLARDVARRLAEGIDARGHALLAVSGGASPLRFFAALRTQPLRWERVTVVLVDERCVAPDHADSNAALVRQHLLRDGAAAARWRPFFDQLPPELAGASGADDPAIERTLDELACAACHRFADLPWPLDLAVLGMGEDGHTASLFPGAPGLDRALLDAGAVAWTRPATAPHPRLTLSLPTLLCARCIVLPLAGAAKQRVFDRACAAESAGLPISLVLHRAARPVQVWLAPTA